METDFSSTYVAGTGVILFPCYPFPTTPKQPEDVVESIVIQGTSVNVDQGVGGTVND
jgi:hypothetical protein